MAFVTAYGIKKKVSLDCSKDVVLVEQAHKNEVDINRILAKYQKTGMLNYVTRNQAKYDDFQPVDFQRAMEIISNGNTLYEELPAAIRQKFKNPMDFLTFINDDKNREAVYEMGLATRPVPPPAQAENSNPTPT